MSGDADDFTVEVRDRTGRPVFIGGVDVTRGDEFLVVERDEGQPARLRCVASDLTAGLTVDQPPALDPRLLLADPALMGSPEGDRKGLAELRRAAQARIDELCGRAGCGLPDSDTPRAPRSPWAARFSAVRLGMALYGWAGLGAGVALVAAAPDRWDSGQLWLGAFLAGVSLLLIIFGEVQPSG